MSISKDVIKQCLISKQREVDANIAVFKKCLMETWEELPGMLRSSSVTQKGKDEILGLIEKINPMYEPAEQQK